MRSFTTTATVLLLGALVVPPALADVAVLTAVSDTTLYEDSEGGLSNGAGTFLFAGRVSKVGKYRLRRGLIAFDVGVAIPAGSTIEAVSLTLVVSQLGATPVEAEPVSVHRALASWGEGASDAPATEGTGTFAELGDATWLHRFFDTTTWSNAGGDYAAEASATTVVGFSGPHVWNSSPALVADVQGWLDAPGSNAGWAVIGNETNPRVATAKRFRSRQFADPDSRPRLAVTFTPPAVTGACCRADGTCAVLDAAGCAASGGAYSGDGTTCAPDACPQASGACCGYAGVCSELTAETCAAASGTFQGAGSACLDAECPVLLEPFVDPLPLLSVAQPDSGKAGDAAHYTIAMRQFQQQLHRDLPATTLWGYDGRYPGPTIEARSEVPVTVTWVNDLRDAGGQPLREHYFPVDSCLHGPDTDGPTPRTVVHLHGGHVPADSDGHPQDTLLPGESDVYSYPNHQLPATLWYHDHALGITRLNVYLGLAGFYLVRDRLEESLGLPAREFEVPLVIQDRTFHPDGSLHYHTAWEDHFLGDTVLVNGKVWPYLAVKRGKYRFRVLNGANHRTFTLELSDRSRFWQIGTDGGLVPDPVERRSITLAPGERADLILDFSGYAAGTRIVLRNDDPALADVMQFVVTAERGHLAPLPAELRPLRKLDETEAARHREFELRQFQDDCTGSIWLINGLHWDHVTDYPELGQSEVWSFVNRSGITHPMHMHLAMFQILDRQPFTIVDGKVVPAGPRVPPGPGEIGWKDTVQVPPGTIARVIARFEDYKGRFAVHCHMLEHEDNEMMRQFETIDRRPDHTLGLLRR